MSPTLQQLVAQSFIEQQLLDVLNLTQPIFSPWNNAIPAMDIHFLEWLQEIAQNTGQRLRARFPTSVSQCIVVNVHGNSVKAEIDGLVHLTSPIDVSIIPVWCDTNTNGFRAQCIIGMVIIWQDGGVTRGCHITPCNTRLYDIQKAIDVSTSFVQRLIKTQGYMYETWTTKCTHERAVFDEFGEASGTAAALMDVVLFMTVFVLSSARPESVHKISELASFARSATFTYDVFEQFAQLFLIKP